MRKCRFCDKSIDDAAVICPHCGRDLIPGRTHVAAAPADVPAAIARVSVVDVDMPFGSMVGFMVKWALAAIPALLIIAALWFAVGFIGGVVFGGVRF